MQNVLGILSSSLHLSPAMPEPEIKSSRPFLAYDFAVQGMEKYLYLPLFLTWSVTDRIGERQKKEICFGYWNDCSSRYS